MLFDLNRSLNYGPLLRPEMATLGDRLLPERQRNYDLTVISNSPLGSQVARIHWAPGLAILSSIDKDDQQFSDIDDLSTQALGEAIPLPALMDWLQGHPSDALPAPTNATPTGFEQGGWHIGTSEITEGKLLAERPQSDTLRGVTIRIRLDR